MAALNPSRFCGLASNTSTTAGRSASPGSSSGLDPAGTLCDTDRDLLTCTLCEGDRVWVGRMQLAERTILLEAIVSAAE